MQKINEAGLNLLKQFEQCRLVAYRDSGGIWTIGWGHTYGVKAGDTCTQEQADAWLIEDMAIAEHGVASAITVPINENQFSAMVVFTYNVGVGNFKSSSVCRLFNAGDKPAASRAFLLWDKARVNGVSTVLAGLQRRRAAEMQLYLAPAPTFENIKPEIIPPPEEGAVSTVEPPKTGNPAVPIGTAVAASAAGAKEVVDRAASVKDSLEWLGLDTEMIIIALAIIAFVGIGYALYSHFKFHRI